MRDKRVAPMLRFFFSSQGRLSRRQFRLGFCLLSLAMLPAILTPLLIPHISWWAAAIIVVVSFLIAYASLAAMSRKRAHDLGKPNIEAFSPLSPIALLFNEGQAQDNQYGPAHVTCHGAQASWRIGGWIVRLGLVSIVVFGVVFYRTFAGPSWKWPDCKAEVVTEGVSAEDAFEQWRQTVVSLHGPDYAQSELTVMRSTTCGAGACKFSARPCVQLR
jgi:uncharacterized membrane protein YhaH (DUF805 family)